MEPYIRGNMATLSPSKMALSAITRSPTARVYNMRLLLLANIPLMVQIILELHDLDHYPQPISASHFSAFSCSIVICVHHILAYAAIQVSLDLVAHGVQRIQMADARSGRDRFGDRCD
jgi:hypothetical protein